MDLVVICHGHMTCTQSIKPINTSPNEIKVTMKMRLFLLVLGIGLLASASSYSQSAYDLPIDEYVYDNGLRLLVLERPGDHRVSAKIFTDFGAMVEEPGELGSAHFLEHLMFKGTKTLGTTNWEKEAPLVEKLFELDAQLIAQMNKDRNTIRERGVFHGDQWTGTTPEIESIRKQIAEVDKQINETRDPGAVMRWYQAYGGTGLTATTEQEYMKFDIILPKDRLELFLRVEADRMTNTIFRGFDEERMILVEQRYGDLNRLTTPYYEQMNAVVGLVHPVFWPEGYLPDFYQYTRTYEKDFYDRYFIANNTTIVLVGGVDMATAKPLVEKYFGWIPRQPEPMRIKSVEPVPQAERRLIYRSEELAPRVEARFMIPGIGHPDRPAFDVMMEVATRRLEDNLAKAGIPGSVDVNTRVVHTSIFGVPGSVNFALIVSENQVDRAEVVLISTLEELKNDGPDATELAIAQKRLKAEWERTKLDASRLNFAIGHFQVMDEWRTLESYLNARAAVDAAALSKVARSYFIPENRTIGQVIRP